MLSESGMDIQAITSEQLFGACLVAQQKTKIFCSRSEYDFEITEQIFERMKSNLPVLKAWYVTNLKVDHPSLWSIPLGLNDYCDYSAFHKVAGDLQYFKLVAEQPRLPQISANFSESTYPQTREEAMRVARGHPKCEILPVDRSVPGFRKSLQLLACSEFAMCPRGNGLDTHRFWKSLYLGCIPICLESDLLECHRGLPLLAIDSWEQLFDLDLIAVSEQIRHQRYDLRRLCLDYWIDCMRSVYLHR